MPAKIIEWPDGLIEKLGKISDIGLSKEYGIGRGTIKRLREKLNIDKYDQKSDTSHKIINGVNHKCCPKCDKYYELDKFGKNMSRWDKLSVYCKKCLVDINKERLINIPHLRAEYLQKHNKRTSRYRDDLLELSDDELAEFYKAERRLKNKLRARRNREIPEYIEKSKKFVSNSPEARRQYRLKHKPKRKAAFIHWEPKFEQQILSLFDYSCGWCSSRVDLELDHFIPVKLGGKTEVGNLYPCCKACNRGIDGKFAQNALLWAKRKFGQELGIERYIYVVGLLEEHRNNYENM